MRSASAVIRVQLRPGPSLHAALVVQAACPPRQGRPLQAGTVTHASPVPRDVQPRTSLVEQVLSKFWVTLRGHEGQVPRSLGPRCFRKGPWSFKLLLKLGRELLACHFSGQNEDPRPSDSFSSTLLPRAQGKWLLLVASGVGAGSPSCRATCSCSAVGTPSSGHVHASDGRPGPARLWLREKPLVSGRVDAT